MRLEQRAVTITSLSAARGTLAAVVLPTVATLEPSLGHPTTRLPTLAGGCAAPRRVDLVIRALSGAGIILALAMRVGFRHAFLQACPDDRLGHVGLHRSQVGCFLRSAPGAHFHRVR